MTLRRSRSTSGITTSVKFSRCVSAGVREVNDPAAQARELVEQRPLDVVALVEAERLT